MIPFIIILLLYLLIILYIIVFYTSMVKDVTFDALNQETNQFSGSMILYLIQLIR